MRAFFDRLRAVLTPQAMLLLAVMLLLAAGMSSAYFPEETSLEARISRTLSAMHGAGKVEVTIREREISVSGGAFAQKSTQRIPCGAIAVTTGADDPVVEMQLRSALCALLGLPPSSVSVIAGGE